MSKSIRTTFTVVGIALGALAQSVFAAPANADQLPSSAEIQRYQQRSSILLDAHLAGMKAGLHLTDQQAALWPPFEAAIREAAKSRSDRWQQMRDRMNANEHPSTLDRLSLMADHLDHNASELRAVVTAGKPFYDSLDDTQKRAFGPLMQEFKPRQGL